jgi:adenosylcobyric acid synthase
MQGGLMVCGTGSDVGKSRIVGGLCRVLVRRGVRVAPFKAQNMALNSFVTPDGHEIGRAQGIQAVAARVPAEVAMNPILLKPSSDQTSQVVVEGRPIGHLSAAEYHDLKPSLLETVLASLADLRSRFDVVIAEGAGSPTEINLLDHDIVNLRIAAEADLPAIVVGDIDRGGVFASLYGTVALLPDEYRSLVRGFLINKFRGDRALLGDGMADLEARCGVPTLGVLPWVDGLTLDAEDSLALRAPLRDGGGAEAARADPLDVAVVRFPRLSNFTDLDALALEPGVTVRFVSSAGELGWPDLIVLPGTKATIDDLEWLRERGLDDAVVAAGERDALVLGVCGGYQMLGREIVDEVESGAGAVKGLGLLDVTTVFAADKTTRQRAGMAMGQRVSGYEIHHGVTERGSGSVGWIHLTDAAESEDEGAIDLVDAHVLGTSLHGLFENDSFRAEFLAEVGRRAGKTFVPARVSFAAAREAQIDRMADILEQHADLDSVFALIGDEA